ncbi:MAG: branched-chain amino acid ABC transporter permease, partial [Lachnospirales bacterium]
MKKMKKRNLILNIIAIALMVGFLIWAEEGKGFGAYNQRIFKTCCIYAICALSMNMVNGFTGLFSLGQPGFMAIGAYVTAFLTVSASDKISIYKIVPISDFMANLSAPFFVALILGGIVAAVFAFFIG